MANKPFVKINSTMTINVTSGLQANDITKKDSDIPNRLKVIPMWASCLIKQGIHVYPSNIVEWNTVKALVKDRILTIAEYLDKVDNEKDNEVELKRQKAIIDEQEKKIKELNLSNLAGE